MPDLMLKIGSFSFNASEATYQSLEQCFNYEWVATKRLRGPVSYQYVGEGERTISLSGSIYIRDRQTISDIPALVVLAATGKPQRLISGFNTVPRIWQYGSIRRGL